MSTPQGPQYPPPGYGYYPTHAPQQPRNGLGTAALVLGIIAVVFAFIPVAGIFIAIPLALVAIGLGIPGMVRAWKGSATNKGVAVSGTSLGGVAFILTIVMTAAVFSAASSPSTPPVAQPKSNVAAGQPTQQEPKSQPEPDKQKEAKPKKKTAGIGDTVKSGDIAFTVTGVSIEQTVGEGFMASEAKGKFVVVDVTMKNTGDDPATMMSASHFAFDKQGRKYQVATDAMMTQDSIFMEDLSPGQSVDGSIYFDVTKGTELVRIEFAGGMLSAPAVVSLK